MLKRQILCMNLAVTLSLYTIYLGALLTQQIDSKMGQTLLSRLDYYVIMFMAYFDACSYHFTITKAVTK